LAVLGLVAAGPSAWAQERTPTPKELWEAYPLDPDEAPASQLPSATPAEFGAAPQTGSEAAADEGGGGIPLVVPITLAALLAFGAGVALGRRRRERAAAAAAAEPPPAEPAPPKRFVARDYPQPARPAPPAPPVPARPARFEAGLEAEAAQPSARPVPQRPGTAGPR